MEGILFWAIVLLIEFNIFRKIRNRTKAKRTLKQEFENEVHNFAIYYKESPFSTVAGIHRPTIAG
jgi:hypothetical protein